MPDVYLRSLNASEANYDYETQSTNNHGWFIKSLDLLKILRADLNDHMNAISILNHIGGIVWPVGDIGRKTPMESSTPTNECPYAMQ